MPTLLTRLGLRAGEVPAPSLDDIDWRAGEITVTGNGRRSERLPRPPDVGATIAAYLRDGRPGPFEGTGGSSCGSGRRTGTDPGITQAVFAGIDTSVIALWLRPSI